MQQHHLLVGYHYINMDSASLAVLVSDLRRLYAGEKLSPRCCNTQNFLSSSLSDRGTVNGKTKSLFWPNEFQDLPDILPILNISPDSCRPRPTLINYRHLKSEIRITTS